MRHEGNRMNRNFQTLEIPNLAYKTTGMNDCMNQNTGNITLFEDLNESRLTENIQLDPNFYYHQVINKELSTSPLLKKYLFFNAILLYILS